MTKYKLRDISPKNTITFTRQNFEELREIFKDKDINEFDLEINDKRGRR